MHNEIDLASKSNNVITLYHGSEVTITKPLYCKGRVNTDYGPGFYAAESYDLAGEWAVLFANRDGFINEYKLDATSLNVLDICLLPIENQIAVIAKNRDTDYEEATSDTEKFIKLFDVDLSNYDLIRGWRADDSFFSCVRAFMRGFMSSEKFKEAMELAKVDKQCCVKSKKAFEGLKFVGSYKALVSAYYDKADIKDKQARSLYSHMVNRTKGTMIRDYLS